MTTLAVGRARALDRDHGTAVARTAGVLAFLSGATFLVGTMLAASIAPGYDFHGAAISDLGVIDSTALLFNGGLIAIGVLELAAGILFFRVHRRPGILATFLLGGVGVIGAGLFPLDTGAAHSLFALSAFVGFNLQAIATAAWVHGPMRVISLVAGLAGLAYVVVMVIGDAGNPAIFGPIGHGGAERMIAYPVMGWLLAFGGYLMASDPAAERER